MEIELKAYPKCPRCGKDLVPIYERTKSEPPKDHMHKELIEEESLNWVCRNCG